jgi:hypothetical protein
MDMQQHRQQMREMHQQTLWVHFAAMLVGVWLLTSPLTLGVLDPGAVGVRAAEVTAERGLAPIALRQQWLAWSDMASSALVLVFATLSLWSRHRWAQWGTCCVGLWLVFAPLLFWAPSAAVYANDTLCGALLIAFSILIPMMPGMGHEAMAEPASIPAGWDYSPSTWSQRLPIIVLALVGFFIARYLSAWQLGHVAEVWDPFFGDGTRRVIDSEVSRAWPVADAGLGAVTYLLEALSGIMGDRRRWRTMPWMVAMFGVLVIPLGGVSIFFIVIQPIVIGTWCTLCLLSAAAMVVMLPYSFDEILAMFQFLAREQQRGASLWSAFWHGGADSGGRREDGPPLAIGAGAWRGLVREGGALPKALLLSAVIGGWLMFSRALFGHEGRMADSDHLVGAMVFTFSICAFSEVVRPLRAANLLFGAWLLLSPWVLDGATAVGTVGVMAAGAALIALALPRGPVVHRYAGWDRWLAW